MASLVGGDVGLEMRLEDRQPIQALERVMAVLEQLGQTAQRIGGIADKAMNSLGETAGAVSGIREIMAAQKAEEDAARKAADAQRQHAEEIAKQKQALQDLRQGLQQIAIAASAVTYALERSAAASLDAYKEQRAAFAGLETVAERTIGNFGAAKDAANAFADDGLANVMNYSKALQDYLTVGYNLDEAKELIQISRDAAAYNRQMGLSFGDAIERMASGVKQGNSVVSDAAGITKNLSVILKEQGYSEQDLQRIQSDAGVRQALLNGLRKEGAIFAGNAARAAQELAGSEAQAANAAFNAKAAIGDALAPAVKGLYDALTPLLKSFTSWAESNPELARSIFLVVGGATALTGAVTALAVAALALRGALGPATLPLIAITASVGALAGYAASLEATARAAAKTKDDLSGLVREYADLKRVIDDETRTEEEHQEASNKIKDVLDKIQQIQPGLVDGWRLNQSALADYNAELDKSIEKHNVLQKILAAIGIKQDPLKQAQKDLDMFIKRRDAEIAELKQQGVENAEEIANNIYGPDIRKAQAKIGELLGSLPETDPENIISRLANRGNILPSTSTSTNNAGGGGGSGQMSPALAAAMEDLQDLQALDKTPDNLRQTLAKVRQILSDHLAELQKLGKDRDLIRLRDITLPADILQADYQAALQGINTKEQLKQLKPDDLKAALEGIRTKFKDYLAQHPDEDLQLQLRIKGADEDALKAPFEAWQKAFQAAEKMGMYQNDQSGRIHDLRAGLGLALAAGMNDEAASLVGEIHQAEQALQQARFEEKFNAISDAREKAFAGAAKQLADLDKQLIDEQAKGDKTDPNKVKALQQQMLDAVRPALEAERDALQALYDSITGTDEQSTKQRAQIEQALNGVKQELYDQDVSAHRYATEAKTAADRAAADQKKALIDQEKSWIQQLAETDLAAIKARNQADEAAQQSKVTGLQSYLSALERLWAAQDRTDKLNDLRQQLANVKSDTRFLKVDASGKEVYTYDLEKAADLEKQIADAEQQDARQRQREALQDQITAEQGKLDAMRTAHQNAETERQRFWAFIEGLDLTKYDDLTAAADKGLGEWAKVFETQLGTLKGKMQAEASEIRGILDGITAAMNNPALTAPTLAVSAAPVLTAPTLPASLLTSLGGYGQPATVNIDSLTVPLPNVTNAQEFREQLPTVLPGSGFNIETLLRSGRAALRTL